MTENKMENRNNTIEILNEQEILFPLVAKEEDPTIVAKRKILCSSPPAE